jgi:hypothetical protein
MNSLDINAVEVESHGHKLYDMWSVKEGKPSNDVDIGGSFDLTNVSYTSDVNTGTVYFERKLVTGDQYDTAITKVVGFFNFREVII